MSKKQVAIKTTLRAVVRMGGATAGKCRGCNRYHASRASTLTNVGAILPSGMVPGSHEAEVWADQALDRLHDEQAQGIIRNGIVDKFCSSCICKIFGSLDSSGMMATAFTMQEMLGLQSWIYIWTTFEPGVGAKSATTFTLHKTPLRSDQIVEYLHRLVRDPMESGVRLLDASA